MSSQIFISVSFLSWENVAFTFGGNRFKRVYKVIFPFFTWLGLLLLHSYLNLLSVMMCHFLSDVAKSSMS